MDNDDISGSRRLPPSPFAPPWMASSPGREYQRHDLDHPQAEWLNIPTTMTPPPGDVILTGTPSGVGPMLPGQEVSVEIEGIGTLTNPGRWNAAR